MGNLCFLAGVFAFLVWGFLPLFWHELHELPALLIVANRVVWSSIWSGCALMVGRLLGYSSQLDQKRIKGRARPVELYSALALGFNWGVFIWAIDSGLVLATSLGYFIAPLLYVASGSLIYGESLSRPKKLATILGGVATVPLMFAGSFTTLITALLLAVSIVLYGNLRKQTRYSPLMGVFIETSILSIPAAAFIVFIVLSGEFSIALADANSTKIHALTILSGPATLVPLILFAWAVKNLDLVVIGFMQYLAPSIQFLLALTFFGENASPTTLLSFSIIWVAISILMMDSLRKAARERKARKNSSLKSPNPCY